MSGPLSKWTKLNEGYSLSPHRSENDLQKLRKFVLQWGCQVDAEHTIKCETYTLAEGLCFLSALPMVYELVTNYAANVDFCVKLEKLLAHTNEECAEFIKSG